MSCCTKACGRRSQTTFTSIELATLSQIYRFSPNEILQFRQRFDRMSRDTKHRFVTLQEFRENMGLLGLESTAALADRIFSTMDKDCRGEVRFRQYLDYMDVLLHGTDDEKAEQSYRLITWGKSEPITFDGFSEMMIGIMKLLNTISGNRIAASGDMLANLFQQLDLDHDGLINLHEYKQGWKSNKKIFEWLDFINYRFADSLNPIEVQQHDEHSFYHQRIEDIEEEIKQCVEMLRGVRKVEGQDLNQSAKSIFEISPKEIYLNIFNPRLHESLLLPVHPGDSPLMTTQRSMTLRSTSMDKGEFSLFRRASVPQDSYGIDALPVRPDLSDIDEEEAKLNGGNPYRVTVSQQKDEREDMKRIAERLEHLLNMTSELRAEYEERESLEAEKGKKAIYNAPGLPEKEKKKAAIHWGDDNWNLILNMMLGIQKSVKSSDANFDQMENVTEKKASEKVKVNLLSTESTSNLIGLKTLYKFRDYAPTVFEHLKRLRGVTVKDYIRSLGVQKIVESLLVGNFSSLEGLMSTGKSGSFFFFSDDGKYLIKTMKKKEFMFLKSILYDYYEHIRNYPNSLLILLYGLHKLLYSKKGPKMQRLYFVVMGNIFSGGMEIHERYDLKGSTYARTTNPKEDLSVERKDLDFLKAGKRIEIGPQMAHELITQLSKDTEFLSAHHIIDYSLLIGIHNLDPSDPAFQYRDFHSNVLPASSGNCLYQVGVVDILTRYSTAKKLEHCVLSCIHPGNTISCIPPIPYMQRFMTFIERIIE